MFPQHFKPNPFLQDKPSEYLDYAHSKLIFSLRFDVDKEIGFNCVRQHSESSYNLIFQSPL